MDDGLVPIVFFPFFVLLVRPGRVLPMRYKCFVEEPAGLFRGWNESIGTHLADVVDINSILTSCLYGR